MVNKSQASRGSSYTWQKPGEGRRQRLDDLLTDRQCELLATALAQVMESRFGSVLIIVKAGRVRFVQPRFNLDADPGGEGGFEVVRQEEKTTETRRARREKEIMATCPWCEKEIDAEQIYKEGIFNERGNNICPHCGAEITITEVISYDYEVE